MFCKSLTPLLIAALLVGSAAIAPVHPLVPSQAVAVEKDPPAPVTPPYIKLPAAKKVRVGRTFYIRPDTNCESLKWIVPDGLEQDTEIVLKDKNAIALASDTAGVYKVMAFGVLNNTLADPAT